MTSTVGQDEARKVVSARMADLKLTIAEVVRRVDVDRKTVKSFLDGTRWPHRNNRAKIAEALEWPADYIDRLASDALDADEALGRVTLVDDPNTDEAARLVGIDRQLAELWRRVEALESALMREGGGEGEQAPANQTPAPDPAHQSGWSLRVHRTTRRPDSPSLGVDPTGVSEDGGSKASEIVDPKD